jgi:competence protein ComGC
MLKNVKKSLVAAAALASVGSAGVIGTQAVLAETNNSNSDPMSSLVDKLASKFNLNKSEVQKVFDEQRSAHEAERDAKVSERLQKLVDDGTITAEQKTKIEAKIKELKEEREANRDSMKDLSDEERKTKMDEKRTELENWAKENGVDLTKLKGVLMGGVVATGQAVEHFKTIS